MGHSYLATGRYLKLTAEAFPDLADQWTDEKMVTGEATVDGVKWCFDQSGKLIR